MSAKQRFVVGSWLLLACVCFAVIGHALWSRIDSHHRVFERAGGWGCLDISGVTCQPPSRIVTTPNRVPAVSLFIVAGAAGIVGVALLRSQPRPAASRDQPTSN